jgi:hypothetical protein
MLKKCIALSAVMIFSLLLAVGCRQAALQNPANMPVLGMSGQSLEAAQVREAIIKAAKERGWVARELRPGLIDASLSVRNHVAEVEIPYDAKTYSINYKNSVNLDYDAEDKTIHNQYNNWVTYLRQSIDAQLSGMK